MPVARGSRGERTTATHLYPIRVPRLNYRARILQPRLLAILIFGCYSVKLCIICRDGGREGRIKTMRETQLCLSYTHAHVSGVNMSFCRHIFFFYYALSVCPDNFFSSICCVHCGRCGEFECRALNLLFFCSSHFWSMEL